MDDKQQARGYRMRAVELRQIAETFEHSGARQDLAGLAGQWDAMAERLETRLPAGVPSPSLDKLQRRGGD